MRHIAAFSAAALLFAVACGGSDSSGITGSNGNNNTATGNMTATIDGKAWGSPTAGAVFKSSILSVAGIDLGLTASVGFATGGVTGPGTYSLTFGNQLAGSGNVTEAGKGWTTGIQGGAGTLTLTTVTANHVVGTFSFDAVGVSGGATGTVHVTNGKFDITF
jgi:hypothetical protein